jgi:hypothetical protein
MLNKSTKGEATQRGYGSGVGTRCAVGECDRGVSGRGPTGEACGDRGWDLWVRPRGAGRQVPCCRDTSNKWSPLHPLGATRQTVTRCEPQFRNKRPYVSASPLSSCGPRCHDDPAADGPESPQVPKGWARPTQSGSGPYPRVPNEIELACALLTFFHSLPFCLEYVLAF